MGDSLQVGLLNDLSLAASESGFRRELSTVVGRIRWNPSDQPHFSSRGPRLAISLLLHPVDLHRAVADCRLRDIGAARGNGAASSVGLC